MEVAVTQRYHRLYIVAAAVYRAIVGAPSAGSGGEPTSTPGPGASGDNVSPLQAVPAVVATVVPAGMASGVGARPAASRALDAPVPLPTDRQRGDPCPTADDSGVTFLDKNCAGASEVNMVLQSVSSISIAPQATDTRAAPLVGADGFATYVDPSKGAMVHYPARWTPVQESGAMAAVEAPDRDSVIALFEQAATASLSQADEVSIAQQQILQVGRPYTAPTYQRITLDGTPALLALASGVGFSTAGTAGLAQVSVVVAVMHARVYVVRAVTLEVSNTLTIAQVTYPYFTPFTTLARSVVFEADPQTAIAFSIAQNMALGYLTATSLTAL